MRRIEDQDDDVAARARGGQTAIEVRSDRAQQMTEDPTTDHGMGEATGNVAGAALLASFGCRANALEKMPGAGKAAPLVFDDAVRIVAMRLDRDLGMETFRSPGRRPLAKGAKLVTDHFRFA